MNNKHSIIEDLYALLSGSISASLGIFLFSKVGMLAGGTTGGALLLAHLAPLSFGELFFLLNLPFYALALIRMSWRFALNTFITVALVSFLADNLGHVLQIGELNPVYASLAGGLLIGMGILILARHNSSLGGLNILVFYLQERFGLRAGYVQLSIDCAIIISGSFLLPLELLLVSILGVVTVNLTLAINHKPGRYQVSRC